MRRGAGALLFFGGLLLGVGLAALVVGLLMAGDWLEVNQTALWIRSDVPRVVTTFMLLTYRHEISNDRLELIVAGLAVVALAFGGGIGIGYWSARLRRG